MTNITKEMKLSNVSAKSGAPMGRPERFRDIPELQPVTCHLLPIGIDEQGYDAGGAYWGTPSNLWRLFSAEVQGIVEGDGYEEGELVDTFIRANSKAGAESHAILCTPFPIVVAPYTGDLDMEEFMDGYYDAALWSSTYTKRSDEDRGSPFSPTDHSHEDDEHDVPMDRDFTSADIAAEAKEAMRKECDDFAGANREDLLAYLEAGRSMSHAGHDFWLTRNGHGAGFWDRGLDELGDRLSAASKVYGSSDLYVGDDGSIYVQ